MSRWVGWAGETDLFQVRRPTGHLVPQGICRDVAQNPKTRHSSRGIVNGIPHSSLEATVAIPLSCSCVGRSTPAMARETDLKFARSADPPGTWCPGGSGTSRATAAVGLECKGGRPSLQQTLRLLLLALRAMHVCVCIHACMYVCMHVYIHIYTYIYLFIYCFYKVCMYVCMYVCKQALVICIGLYCIYELRSIARHRSDTHEANTELSHPFLCFLQLTSPLPPQPSSSSSSSWWGTAAASGIAARTAPRPPAPARRALCSKASGVKTR